MSLTQQIENLVEFAPDDLQNTVAALAPALEKAAKELCLQYFVAIGATGQWIATTLQNRQSQQEITVVYGFANASDLQAFYQKSSDSVVLPVIDLLFQLTALDDIDRLIFFDTADFSRGKHVGKLDLQRSIEQQLKSTAILPPEHFC